MSIGDGKSERLLVDSVTTRCLAAITRRMAVLIIFDVRAQHRCRKGTENVAGLASKAMLSMI